MKTGLYAGGSAQETRSYGYVSWTGYDGYGSSSATDAYAFACSVLGSRNEIDARYVDYVYQAKAHFYYQHPSPFQGLFLLHMDIPMQIDTKTQ